MKIKVRVTPKAGRNVVVWPDELMAETTEIVRVYVTAVPEDGKANKAVIALLAKEMGVAKSCIKVVVGEAARDKVIEIDA